MQELALAAAGFRHDEPQANTPISLKTTQLLIKQKDLDRAVRIALGDVPMVEDILLNSLIQPAGRDSNDRQRYFRFAHQSFFDWFLARAIVQFDLQVSGISEVTQTFVKNMKSALLAGESLP